MILSHILRSIQLIKLNKEKCIIPYFAEYVRASESLAEIELLIQNNPNHSLVPLAQFLKSQIEMYEKSNPDQKTWLKENPHYA